MQYHLRGDDDGARDDVGLEHVEAQQQVHALVLRLLQQRRDPPVVALQGAQGAEVADARGDEAGHAGDGLEHDEAPLDGLDRRVLEKRATQEATGQVRYGQ
jgi:hypothetical protein